MIVDYGYIVFPMIIVMYAMVLKTVCAYLDWRQVIALAANGIYGIVWMCCERVIGRWQREWKSEEAQFIEIDRREILSADKERQRMSAADEVNFEC